MLIVIILLEETLLNIEVTDLEIKKIGITSLTQMFNMEEIEEIPLLPQLPLHYVSLWVKGLGLEKDRSLV